MLCPNKVQVGIVLSQLDQERSLATADVQNIAAAVLSEFARQNRDINIPVGICLDFENPCDHVGTLKANGLLKEGAHTARTLSPQKRVMLCHRPGAGVSSPQGSPRPYHC